MRFQKAEQLLNVALWMQRRSDGVSMKEVCEKFDVGLRTAQRMRDAIERLFIDLEEIPNDTKEKRWRLPQGRLDRIAHVSTHELAALEIAEDRLRQDSLHDDADNLKLLNQKIRTVMKPRDRTRVETDLEFLSENEAFAAKPGPITLLADGVYERLKDAVLRSQKIQIQYVSRKGQESEPVLEPYGFLFGHRHYLLAINSTRKKGELRTYSLSGIRRVEVLSSNFQRDESISLQEHAQRSFGVFVEEEGPSDVVWRFSPGAASNANAFRFHANEVKEEQPDGSLVVKFTAGGLVEMAWHLLMWGDNVEVIAPEKLREMVEPAQKPWGALP